MKKSTLVFLNLASLGYLAYKERDVIKSAVTKGAGYVAVSKEKLEEFVDNISEKLELPKEDGQKIIEDILENSKKMKDDIEHRIEEQVENLVQKLKIARMDEIKTLEKRIEELESKIAATKEG